MFFATRITAFVFFVSCLSLAACGGEGDPDQINGGIWGRGGGLKTPGSRLTPRPWDLESGKEARQTATINAAYVRRRGQATGPTDPS